MRRGLTRSPVFFLALLSLSCSLFRARVKPYPAGLIFPLAEAGRVTVEGDVNGTLVRGEDGRLYFSTDKGGLYCLESAAPKIAWQLINPVAFGCPPDLAPDRIFLWDLDNTVRCFDRTGKPGWQTKIGDKFLSPLSHDRERLYIGTEAGDLIALSQATGEELWRFRTQGPISAAAVFYEDMIIAGSRDGSVYLLSPTGVKRGAVVLGSPVSVTPLVDGHYLYVGTEDFAFHCWDLSRRKDKWKIRAAGRVLAPPGADEKRVYLQASNGVLYALKKNGGDILWWWIGPSRSPFELGSDGERVLIASHSPLLFSLDKKTGQVAGKYEAETEIRSNPVWADPYLILSVYDTAADQGILAFFEKEVKLELTASVTSPQPVGSEITFTAAVSGFYLPQFEFTLRQGEEKTVVQKADVKETWVWYPDKEGSYAVSVKVSDEKKTKEAEIPFEITASEKKDEGKDVGKGDKR
jgi:outer membrane protein assembly factor BamB